jgi:hypothetical protein
METPFSNPQLPQSVEPGLSDDYIREKLVEA